MMSQSNYRLVKTLLLVFLGLWVVLTLFPFYWQFITAMKSAAETNRTIPTFWPEEWHPENFNLIFAEASNFQALVDSFIIATGNTLAALVLGSLAGYAFARFPRQAGGENLAFWILSNRMFPPVAVLIPMFFLFDATPWGTDSHISLIILYLVFNMPLATWLMMVFFRDAPRELEEAASLDGYTPLRAFFKVTLPLVLPGMISVAMLCWIFAWNE
ncbi:MAG: carbohydrate ABC transporter permease, partial [Kiloniellales bacterium]|nr:carbohydrate ABC transporter permease [Kiloniellales bacterium]